MKPWYNIRDISNLVKLFYRAVASNDPLGAGAIYGCLFDFLQTGRIYMQERSVKYKWKRLVTYLDDQLEDIQKKAMDFPMPVQQALVAKVTLYQHAKMRNL